MRIRPYSSGDLAAIKRIHNGKFELPDPSHGLMLVKKCLVDDDEQVRMAAFGRLHISAMLFVDPTWESPKIRLAMIKELQKDMDATAGAFGIDIATTQAEGRFAERLKDLGWTRGFGEMFYRSID